MSRRPVIVANWKMLLSHKAALEALRGLKQQLKDVTADSDIVICPSFPSLPAAAELVAKSKKISLGAQNVHHSERGAWTGEVSVLTLTPFVDWCIIGHSEQRALTGESDEDIAAKAELLLKYGIIPIICIGETLEERRADETIDKITTQLNVLIAKLPRVAFSKLVLTYEPIWAISSNEPTELPDPADIAGTTLLMRKVIAERFGQDTAERLRILYGGSVTADNVTSFVSEPSIDGVLVGSASTRPLQFVNIVKAVQAAHGNNA